MKHKPFFSYACRFADPGSKLPHLRVIYVFPRQTSSAVSTNLIFPCSEAALHGDRKEKPSSSFKHLKVQAPLDHQKLNQIMTTA